MRKINLSKKLSLNKESISELNLLELNKIDGGKFPPGYSRGCVCTGSRVKTCGYYCPDEVIK